MKVLGFRVSVLALVVGFVLLGGCEKKPGGGGGGGGSGSGLKEVRLGYFANVTHAQAVLGVESGAFAKAVLPAGFSTKVFNAGPSLIEALFAEEVDIGYIGPGPAIMGHGKSKGQGVRVVSGAAANGALIVARKDSGINSLADLKGKRIATPQLGNTQDISAKHYVMAVLGQGDASNVLAVANAEQAAMMVRRQIDAAWVPEPWGSRLIAVAEGKLIAEEKDIREMWPGGELALTVVITTPKFLKAHRAVLGKVLGVHRGLTKRLQEEPGKCVGELDAALLKLTGKRLPAGVLEASVKHVKFTDDPLEGTLEAMAKWSYELRFAKEVVGIEGLVDLSVLKGK
ncbi:MAG: aliphatic sulfonate ABC transporter substrate-binding protein [Planctomycetota bacterium]|nr:aliphatic sulfonate ABC transporter substrate-binding protein [Planctomycetota bacterium]